MTNRLYTFAHLAPEVSKEDPICEICDQNHAVWHWTEEADGGEIVHGHDMLVCRSCSAFLVSSVPCPVAVSNLDAVAWLEKHENQNGAAVLLAHHIEEPGTYFIRTLNQLEGDNGFYEFAITQRESWLIPSIGVASK